ncbi:hypothetical protein [Streptomyces fractus]|uniref:hypothetical protein n=1 Tax=Streptomyces fractus TaxID=641806 RepID=UPI003CF1BCE8
MHDQTVLRTEGIADFFGRQPEVKAEADDKITPALKSLCPSRGTRRSATSFGLRGSSLADMAGIGEDETADTGTFLITRCRHPNDHESRVRSVIHPNPRHLQASWMIPGICTSPADSGGITFYARNFHSG